MIAKTRTDGRRSPLYRASAKKVDIVTVPSMRYLMIDGAGDPNAPAFQQAVQALYSVSYTLRFLVRQRGGPEFSVAPLEGLWWADDYASFTSSGSDKSAWKWTLMIAQPAAVTPRLFEAARRTVVHEKGIAAAAHLRLTSFREGRAAQMLHVGPYATEHATVERIHRAIAEQGGTLAGKHHEIYLGDPRRSSPEKLRTIVRQPFA